ncbi:MAG: histidine phosphatase family protein [Candidatus Puniceispirillaceae bacterium]
MSSKTTPIILNLIRHAPSVPAGYLYGRTDTDIDTIDSALCANLRRLIEPVGTVFCSPAKRCQKTCLSILSAQQAHYDNDALWEQSFGDWDGLAFDSLPDVGVMTDDELVKFAPPHGESFYELCQRVHPLLRQLCENSQSDSLTFFVHAGVIRAALALAFHNMPAALKCEIDTLSVTKLRYLGDNGFSVISVNQVPTL